MKTIAQEVIHEEQGAYAKRTILVWDGLTTPYEANAAISPVLDPEWQAESCCACENKDGEICELEEARDGLKSDLEDQVYRWRERCKLVVKIARTMTATRDRALGKANDRIAALEEEIAKLRPMKMESPVKTPRKRPAYKR